MALETDLKIEREWRGTLQQSLDKEKAKVAKLQTDIQHLEETKKVTQFCHFLSYLLTSENIRYNSVMYLLTYLLTCMNSLLIHFLVYQEFWQYWLELYSVSLLDFVKKLVSSYLYLVV